MTSRGISGTCSWFKQQSQDYSPKHLHPAPALLNPMSKHLGKQCRAASFTLSCQILYLKYRSSLASPYYSCLTITQTLDISPVHLIHSCTTAALVQSPLHLCSENVTDSPWLDCVLALWVFHELISIYPSYLFPYTPCHKCYKSDRKSVV